MLDIIAETALELPTEVVVAIIAGVQAVFLAMLGIAAKLAVDYLKAIRESVHAPDTSQPPRTNGNRALIDYAIEASSGIAHLQEQHEALRELVVDDIEWRKQHTGGPFETGASARAFVGELHESLSRIERKIDEHVDWEMGQKYDSSMRSPGSQPKRHDDPRPTNQEG